VYWGEPCRQFRLEKGFGRGTSVFGLKVADFTGDARPDVLTLHDVTEFKSELFENLEDGFKARPAALASGEPFGGNGCLGLAVGDLDRDGDVDAVSGHRGTRLFVSLNDGRGNFTRTDLPCRGWHNDVEIGDLDGDGRSDIVQAAPPAIYWNTGGAEFSTPT